MIINKIKYNSYFCSKSKKNCMIQLYNLTESASRAKQQHHHFLPGSWSLIAHVICSNVCNCFITKINKMPVKGHF